MTILDTFYMVFKSLGASGTKADLDKINESTTKLDNSLKKTSASTELATNYFNNMARSLVGVAAGAFSLVSILSAFSKTTNEVIGLSVLSDQLNVNISDLDAWGQAVQRNGGTVEGFQNSIASLAQHFGSSAQVAFKLLPQLADVFHRLGSTRAQQYGKLLGLDQGTILLLQQGRREVEDLIRRQKELGVVTQKDKEISDEFSVSVSDTGNAFRYLFIVLERDLLPVLTKVLNYVRPIFTYLTEHKDLVIGALIGIAAAAAPLVVGFILANAAIIGTTLAISALIALVALAYEDFKVFKAGGDSLLGDWIARWPVLGDIVNGVLSHWSLLLDAIGAQIVAVVKGLKLIGYAFDYVFGRKSSAADLDRANRYLAEAGNSSINNTTHNSILGGNSANREQNVSVGEITINTQATNGYGIANELQKTLSTQLRQVSDFYADGVLT